MRNVTTAFTSYKSFARGLVVFGSAVLALAGCAVDASPEAEEPSATSAEELRIGSGGGGLGFTCENGTCTCSKTIEGDCDRMRINCTGDLSGLDTCLKGWLTTDCTCTTATRTAPKSPIYAIPRGSVGGVLVAQ